MVVDENRGFTLARIVEFQLCGGGAVPQHRNVRQVVKVAPATPHAQRGQLRVVGVLKLAVKGLADTHRLRTQVRVGTHPGGRLGHGVLAFFAILRRRPEVVESRLAPQREAGVTSGHGGGGEKNENGVGDRVVYVARPQHEVVDLPNKVFAQGPFLARAQGQWNTDAANVVTTPNSHDCDPALDGQRFIVLKWEVQLKDLGVGHGDDVRCADQLKRRHWKPGLAWQPLRKQTFEFTAHRHERTLFLDIER